MTDYTLAGYSSFGSEYVTPAGERCSACSLDGQQCIRLLHHPLPLPLPFFVPVHCFAFVTPPPSEPVNIGPIVGGVVVALVLVAIIGIVIIAVVIM